MLPCLASLYCCSTALLASDIGSLLVVYVLHTLVQSTLLDSDTGEPEPTCNRTNFYYNV